MIRNMATLNNKAAAIVQTYPEVHACTDITGFGLLGHAYEMAAGSDATLKLHSTQIPLLPGAKELANMGIVPTGAYRNMEYVKKHVEVLDSAEQCLVDLISDPQTSGGLLVALPAEYAHDYVKKLAEASISASIVGEVIEKQEKDLIIA